MRTLGVALVAVAAVVGSLSVAWRSGAHRLILPPPPRRPPNPLFNLDAIRSAGL